MSHDKYVATQRERFAKVMAARKSSRELVGLVEKLAESDKFTIGARPYCFADLVTVCTERVANTALEDLLVAIKDVWVGDIIRNAFKDETDAIVRGLVRRVLELTTTDEAIERRMFLMHFGGLIKDNEHAITLAVAAGLPKEGEARLRDALARLAAKPRVEAPCPF
ncbi:hypothetical protein WL29_21935 [Burkholderia ubonensis]|uniref:Uncharacterized protein n=1 Tax=Burkholderia ubonensis TaxID=101571 RepID=A0A119HFJ1_9BURK|nr:hypothetical protein [Burkholderia ubonensis]KWA84029.1 hypothetical protein WL29_21935 [Burkholderia ubonensis]